MPRRFLSTGKGFVQRIVRQLRARFRFFLTFYRELIS